MFLYSVALLFVNTLPLTIAFTPDAMFNALLSERVLSENVDSRTDRFLSSLKTTFLTVFPVNIHPEIVL